MAVHNDTTIRVYQAYNHKIAEEAISQGTFGPSFKLERMTWIKPSFLWMMYRSGWGTKVNQERILAIDMKREGFDYIISQAVSTAYESKNMFGYEEWKKQLTTSEVRCQWDPDRDLYGNPIDKRAIQLGIKGSCVERFIKEWIVNIEDITKQVIIWRGQRDKGLLDEKELPVEEEYQV